MTRDKSKNKGNASPNAPRSLPIRLAEHPTRESVEDDMMGPRQLAWFVNAIRLVDRPTLGFGHIHHLGIIT